MYKLDLETRLYRNFKYLVGIWGVSVVMGTIGCTDQGLPNFGYDYGVLREDVCGDGILGRSEQCEDNNAMDGDGCSSTCMIEYPSAAGDMVAGDMVAGEMVAGEMVAGEMIAGEMIAGEMIAGEMVAGEMAAGSDGLLCGDGIIGLGETCDDGNQEEGDGCSSACQVESMGCVDDNNEPNNDVNNSTIIPLSEGQDSQEYMLCLEDRDYYEIQGCLRGELDVIVEFDVNVTDIDIRLTTLDGRLLDSSALANQIEQVSHYFAQDEPIYLEVAGYLDSSEGNYRIITNLRNCTDQNNLCSQDEDCPMDEVCNSGVCTIPAQGCNADVDCGPSESCVNGSCETNATRCVFNFDCQLGEVCEAGVCVADNSPECYWDFDCFFGQSCQNGVCMDAPILEDDLYEENDDQNEATTLEPGSYNNLTLVSNDEDYFAVEVCAGGTLEATINFLQSVGDLELRIEDSLGIILDDSTGIFDSESVSASNRESQVVTQYVVVYGYSDESGNYSLTINVSGCDENPVEPLGDDIYEENDFFQDAASLTPGFYDNLTLTTNDDDWYTIEVCEGGTLDIDVLFSHAQGDLSAWLYDEALFYLSSSISFTDNESLSRTFISAETVYLKVLSYGAEADYQLNIEVSGCIEGLLPDRLEENDTRETGELLTPNLYSNLTITSGDEDWILFDVCEGGTINIDLTFSDEVGDIDANLYDEFGSSVASGYSFSDNESLVHRNAQAGRYALRVFAYSSTENTYDLQFSITDCAPPPLEPDRLEEDDTRETGEILLPNLYSNLTITPNDDDWILFDVCEGGTITIDIRFTHADGDIDAYLYDPNEFYESSSTTNTDDENIVVNNASAGRYALKIYGFSGAENTYDLQFSITDCATDPPPPPPPSTLEPDRLEENDTRETAELLAPNYYGNLNLIGYDEDWIAIDVCEGANLIIEVLFSHAEGDIDLNLRTADDAYIDGSLSEDDNETVSATNLSAGLVYLRIFGYGDDVTYDLNITMTCP